MSNEKPAYMLVVATIEDSDKMVDYQRALTASGLYPDNHGGYLVKGRPLEIFEGEWPSNQAVVIAKFASAQNAHDFWHSEQYQEQIKPLRQGAGRFSVSLFEEID